MIPDFLHGLRPTLMTLLLMLQQRPFDPISGSFQNISWIILIRPPGRDYCQARNGKEAELLINVGESEATERRHILL